MGLVAVGDIHGCARSLADLLRTLDLQASDDIIFIGDYIDRGPDSRGVIDQLLDLQQHHSCTFLRGNHEALFLGYWDHGEADVFLHNGGRQTLASYGMEVGDLTIPESHLSFIRRTRLYRETPEFLFVHAGLRPGLSVADNLAMGDEMTYLWERSHIACPDEDLAWEKTVVCGHTPVPEVIDRAKLINIDTGCVFRHRVDYGRLSAVRLPEREYISVPCSDRF
ncbi:MAG: serine/threonine protein phosphatase [Rhodothermales bacterium]|nr:serine/threonine protein phosphatase [Rhodothermales bacterium]MBO6778824.1 serine/threonine protein phosphatase [Rhodothermales bacterium]